MITKIVFAKDASLPPHAHNEATEHLIIVVTGRFLLYEEGAALAEITVGQTHFFRAGVRHAIKALEDGSSYLNIKGWGIERVE